MVEVLDVFEEVNNHLIDLLKDLSDDEWNRDTCLKGRRVKDLASHILDTSLRRLSMGRDNYFAETPKGYSHDELVEFIQGLNSSWISATNRLSPKIIISMLEVSERELLTYLKTLNPYDKALFPVNWAGEDLSQNCFDIAREYTEKWHHQMQIREALGREEDFYEEKFFKPIIEVFIQAIPYTYDQLGMDNFTLEIEIIGSCGGKYYINKANNHTKFVDRLDSKNKVKIEQKEFWKLATNSIDRGSIDLEVEGDEDISKHLLTLCAVMS